MICHQTALLHFFDVNIPCGTVHVTSTNQTEDVPAPHAVMLTMTPHPNQKHLSREFQVVSVLGTTAKNKIHYQIVAKFIW